MKSIVSLSLLSAITGFAALTDVPDMTEFNVHGYGQPMNAPHIEHGNWSVGVDFLYWQAQEDNLEYGLREQVTFMVQPRNFFNAYESLKLNFHWDPGFRVNFGYSDDDRSWNLLATYTYMHNTAKNSESVAGLNRSSSTEINAYALGTSWFPIALAPISTSATAHWSLNYNVGDMTYGRNIFISKSLAFNPFIGIRGGAIAQDYKTYYFHPSFNVSEFSGASIVLNGGTTQFKAKSKYDFGGIRGGTDLLWHWARNWGLLGKISVSALYGKFHVKEKFIGWSVSNFTGANALYPASLIDNDSYWRARANLEGYLGLQWETFFSCAYHLALNLGYEVSYWFQQNEFFDIFSQSTTVSGGTAVSGTFNALSKVRREGNLGLQGLTFNAVFDF